MTIDTKKKLLKALVIIIAVLVGCGVLAASNFGALLMYVVSFVFGIVATKAYQKITGLKE